MNTDHTSYWLMKGGVRLGPMGFSELVRAIDSPASPVWREGLPDWCAAENVPELAGLFRVQQPVMPPAASFSAVQQPAPAAAPGASGEETEPMPPTYLAWSVVTMLLCCLPTGIAALVYSTKVSQRWLAGDRAGARHASEMAALWIIVTIVCGLIALPFQIIMAML